VKKLSFLWVLVLTLAVAGVASAADQELLAADVEKFNDVTATVTSTDLTLDSGDELKVSGAEKLTAAGWARLDAVIKSWAQPAKTIKIKLNNGQDVVADNAFKENGAIIEFTANAQLKKIGNSAFEGASKLTVVNIATATTLESVGSNAVKGTALGTFESNTAGNNFKSIGTGAFEGVKTLTTANFGTNFLLKNIPANAFKGCVVLANGTLTLPVTIETIGASAFEGAKALAAFGIPGGVKTIGDAAFKDCVALAAVTIPATGHLTTIGNSAFEGCKALTAVDFTPAVALTTIGDNAFKGAKLLATVTGFDTTKLTTIGAGAFEGTILDTSGSGALGLPETVTKIGARAFALKSGSAGTVDIVLRAGTDTAETPTTPAELAAVLQGIDMTNAFKGIPSGKIGNISIADEDNEELLGDLMDVIGVLNKDTDPDTVAIVTALTKAGFSPIQIVKLCQVDDLEVLSSAVVNAIAERVPTTLPDDGTLPDNGGTTPPGGGTTPPGGGTTPPGDDDESPVSGSSSGGCSTGVALPFAAMLALGLVKRKSGK
jgi:flagellar basal body rod protein FlgG